MTHNIPPEIVHDAEQLWAEANAKLNQGIDYLVGDMKARAEKGIMDDSLSGMATVVATEEIIEQHGGINPLLLAMWQAAVYRLARQQFEQKEAE